MVIQKSSIIVNVDTA